MRLCSYVAVAAVALGAGGCEARREPGHYSVLAGEVIACQPDTGELTIRGPRRTAEGPEEQTSYCLITRDSEIYINDRFSSIREIRPGDTVELIVRRDSDPQSGPDAGLQRYVVAFAYVDRPLPPAPRPELTPTDAPAGSGTPEGQTPAEG